MGKSTKTYEERIQEKDLRIEKLAQELKRYEAQKKQLEKRRKEEERKIRTHRLIEIGAAVESVLGRCIEIEEIPKLIAFLNRQEANAQLARKIEVALPKELSRECQIEIVRRYVQDDFVSVGMCADWALHVARCPGTSVLRGPERSVEKAMAIPMYTLC